MMTKQEIKDWCSEMLTKPHRLAINEESYFKYVWEDGTVYECRITEWSVSRKETKVYINGELVYIVKGE